MMMAGRGHDKKPKLTPELRELFDRHNRLVADEMAALLAESAVLLDEVGRLSQKLAYLEHDRRRLILCLAQASSERASGE